MINLRDKFLILFLFFSMISCSVVSSEIRKEAGPPVSFRTLLKEAESRVGKTVILGGYIQDTLNLDGTTLIEVLQAPLTFRDVPKSREYSQGSFVVLSRGVVERNRLLNGRAITVAGKVLGLSKEKRENCPPPCLNIQAQEIHLGPEYDPGRPSGYAPTDDTWNTPFPSDWYLR